MLDVDNDVAQKVIEGFQIPSQPKVLQDIQHCLSGERTDVAHVAEELAKDVGLSAYILKTVNAPFFGMHRAVADVSQAVMFLGLKSLHDLVLTHSVRTAWNQSDASISLERFWDTCTETAAMCAMAVEHLELKSFCPKEYAYTVGLFHDCGIAAMASKFPDYKETLMTVNEQIGMPFTDTEEERHKTNHATVGYYITRAWHLPDELCQFVSRHHDATFLTDQNIDDTHRYLFLCLKVATQAISILRRSKDDSEWPIYEPLICEYLGHTPEELNEIIQSLASEFEREFV